MSYSHILVAVAATPESQQLLDKAVSIARPVNARISLITLVSDPELYNQFAAPMLEDLREVMQEETQDFIDKLSKEAEYPIEHTFITYGALNEHILDVCSKHAVDLVIYGNHNHSFFSRAACSAKSVIHTSQVDVLLVPLAGD
ncbi:universal stress protein UspC [Citrobacter portucalensis]|uniref:universal stress protein UspC n=1 Tax=Citrobacter portucalensis TaxID=1639133 RepID=UPI0011F080D1|nr:universal stress protein UspC [Citrobacter portucalensis]KAA0568553.1 universal stress protein UspC [Citrobacter portucalensis]MEB0979326.1 universal stress protein UspC [Citrobacter portucalensis]WII78406.1 universal stress protein UspC [Citrobacter portucalensis]BBV40485.1 universal stress protein [Citrobacter portucalensis]BBV45419.1 universal stress protein [Citrobacter portucalensis]